MSYLQGNPILAEVRRGENIVKTFLQYVWYKTNCQYERYIRHQNVSHGWRDFNFAWLLKSTRCGFETKPEVSFPLYSVTFHLS